MKATTTTERPLVAADAPLRLRPAALTVVAPLLLALLTLLPRALGLADFFTTDEAYHWITRTERFAAALAEGRWADTNLTGHPGVTLMWLGTLGLRLQEWAVAAGWAVPPDPIGHLAWLRLGPVLAHALIVPAAYLLLLRLVRPAVALVAALLWATSPFLVAHGRLLHLDALLTGLSTLAVLSALVACRAARPRPWLILTGVLTGLALLTKGPALILLPFLGLALFALAPVDLASAASRGPARQLARRLGWSITRYLLVLAAAALTVLALWPAVWAVPEAAVGRYLAEILDNGGRPNGDGQFFLGSSNPDPGPLFYPLVTLFRLTPVELLGLAALLGFAIARLRSVMGAGRRQPVPEAAAARTSPGATAAPLRLAPGADRHAEIVALLALAAFALWWLLVMTSGPKKFDRYLLPAWPALLVLAAAGIVATTSRLARRGPVRLLHIASGVLAFQALTLAWFHPYYLSYYSPLLGGGPVAQRTFLIGWGEGMDQVGAFLRERPDVASGQVLSALPPTLQPFVPVPVQEVRAIERIPANYAVVYLESLQRGDAPTIYARIQETIPLHTVRIHGIDYAQVHQLARPFATPVDATFGDALRLRGYTAELGGGQLVVTPSWDVRAQLPGDLMLFVHLIDEAGRRVSGIDLPPGGASLPPTGQWRPGEQVAVPLPLPLPADLPAGRYTLTLGLYDPATFVRLPLTAGPAADPVTAGDNAALLGEVALP